MLNFMKTGQLLACHHRSDITKVFMYSIRRLSSNNNDEPCPTKPDPVCAPPPPPSPCAPMPTDPPAICPNVPSMSDPCNYTPPADLDPDYPDMTKIKKLQCMFQAQDGVPVYLKRGMVDLILYYATLGMVVISFFAVMFVAFM